MRRKILWMHVSVLCVALFSAAQNPAQAQGPDKSLLDSIFGGLVKPDEPGFALLIRYGGENLYIRTEGVRDLRSKVKIDAHTNFRLASFTKQFTAMAVMLLVHDHKLRYDETLTQIFPGFPAYGKNITVRNLLNHTGGLPDYEDLMDCCGDSAKFMDLVAGAPDSRRGSPQAVRSTDAKQVSARDELVLQQFRLRRSRPNRCKGVGPILR